MPVFTPPPLKLRDLQGRTRLLEFTEPVIMGIVNLTPDSFSDGGELLAAGETPKLKREAFLAKVHALWQGGAQILDLGAESTRPGAEPITAAFELQRLLPALELLKQTNLPLFLSIDTTKAEVAHAGLALGATMINDVSSLADPELLSIVAKAGEEIALILMHSRGTPKTMQVGPIYYEDIVAEVDRTFTELLQRATLSGIAAERLILDPGIGFGKTTAHNLRLSRELAKFHHFKRPLLYGPSRKNFLGELTGKPPQERDQATAIASALSLYLGAQIIRVHNPAAMQDALKIASAFKNN